MYRVGDMVVVNDRMQRDYRYEIAAPPGKDFMPAFSPAEMLAMGVPKWFATARISDRPNPALNCFGVKSRKPLSYWKMKGWIIGPDPRGWFQ